MKIYLATSSSGVKKERRKEMIKCCRPLYLLETFYSGEKCCAMVQNDVGTDNFLLDSGAFSYMNGKSITEKQMEEYIEKYICHIKKYNVKYFFEMDVDCIFNNQITLIGMLIGQYLIKLIIAALDTPFFYFLTKNIKEIN